MYSTCLRLWAVLLLSLSIAGCGTLIAAYDETFDQSLNKFSEDTAKFLAAAAAGGPERSISSKETTAYYAATYNLLDRLSARASLSRANFACPANPTLKAIVAEADLPEDSDKFDCREVQLLAVRVFVKQMQHAHEQGSTLNRFEINATGRPLQAATMGAIQTFLVNKPSK